MAAGKASVATSTSAFNRAVIGLLTLIVGMLGYIGTAIAQIPTTGPPVTTTQPPATTLVPTTTTTLPPVTTTVPPVPTTQPPISTLGYPDATNTGVPPGTVLTQVPEQATSGPGWHWDPRGWFQTDAKNAVISGLDIHGTLDVCADCSGTTIKNTRVTTDGSFSLIVRYDWSAATPHGATGVTIQDSEVRGGPAGSGAAITVQSGLAVTITRVNVHNTSTAIQLDRGSITDSYLWDLHVVPNGTHVNGTTSNGGRGNGGLTIRHNTVLNSLGQTDAISLFQDTGVQEDVTIDNNLVAGGGYVIYGGSGNKGPSKNIKITNNRISTRYFPLGGGYGWLAYFTPGDPGNVLSGNRYYETGALVPGG